MTDLSECRERALGLLATREHSQQELQAKLRARDFDSGTIAAVIEQLVSKNLLSDERFAQLYAEQRANRGYGPLRIVQELGQRGVKAELIEHVMADYQTEWVAHAQRVWQKYKRLHPHALPAKQQQFLYYRGFSYEQIRAACCE